MYILYKSVKKDNTYKNKIIAEYDNCEDAYNDMFTEIEYELGYSPCAITHINDCGDYSDRYYYGVEDNYYVIKELNK